MRAVKVEWASFSVMRASEGGEGQVAAMRRLRAAGVPCRAAHSPYIGHSGIDVPKKYELIAQRVLWRQ